MSSDNDEGSSVSMSGDPVMPVFAPESSAERPASSIGPTMTGVPYPSDAALGRRLSPATRPAARATSSLSKLLRRLLYRELNSGRIARIRLSISCCRSSAVKSDERTAIICRRRARACEAAAGPISDEMGAEAEPLNGSDGVGGEAKVEGENCDIVGERSVFDGEGNEERKFGSGERREGEECCR